MKEAEDGLLQQWRVEGQKVKWKKGTKGKSTQAAAAPYGINMTEGLGFG